MTCALLVGLTAHGATAATRTVAAALHDVDPEFDSELLQAVAAGEGGACLRGMVLESLSQALEEDEKERRTAEEEQAAAAVAGGGQGGVGDPFEEIPEAAEDVDADELVRQYGDAMTELVHTQVTNRSLSFACLIFARLPTHRPIGRRGVTVKNWLIHGAVFHNESVCRR